MKKARGVLVLLLAALFTHGQEISRYDADSLLKFINVHNASDTSRLKSLMALASFNILKPGEFKTDLDSADAFIKQATGLNDKIRSPEANGFLQLLTAYLNKETGRNLKPSFATAVEILKTTKDKFHLATAELELSKFYDARKPEELPQKIELVSNALMLLQHTGTEKQKIYAIKELRNNYGFGGYDDDLWKDRFLQGILLISNNVHESDEGGWVRLEIIDLHLRQGKTAMVENELVKLQNYYKSNDVPAHRVRK